MNKALLNKLAGFLVPEIFAVVIIGITRHSNVAGAGILIFFEFVIVPALMGVISAWFWRDLELPGTKLTLYSIFNTFLAIVLSAIFLGEGVICLIIVSPLIFCFVLAGAHG